MPPTKIALIGASGNLGPNILSALLSTPTLTITVIHRASSHATFPPNTHTISIPDSATLTDYTTALTNQDALITTFAGSNADLQITLADACVAAGVKLFIPADFGSCDSNSRFALELMPLYQGKKRVREYLQGLAKEGKLSWTSLVTGHFFDYGLKSGLLLADLEKRRMVVFDGGEVVWSASTLAQVGRAVVAVLRDPEKVKDQMVYVQSFSLTQNELVRVLEEVMRVKWGVEETSSAVFIERTKRKIDESGGKDAHAREDLVGVVGIVDGDWSKKKDLVNDVLGIEEENLAEVVKRVVGEMKK